MSSLSKTLLDFAEVMERIEENNGEITDEILPVLTAVEASVATKIDGYVGFVDCLRGQIERTKKTIEKFKETLKTLENVETRLKDNVKLVMQSHDLLALNGNERTIKLVNAGGLQAMEKPADLFHTVECVNENYATEFQDLVEQKTVYVLKDKDKFKQAVKDNKLKSCFLLPRSKYVKFI